MNDWFPSIQYFVSQGFVVIARNFRGSTRFGRKFMEANRGDCGGGDLRDCVAAVDFLKETGYVDSNRVAFMGASYGGYLTLMALAKFPNLWVAGVAFVPFANWFTAHKNEDPTLQANDEWPMGDPISNKELWRGRSPVFFADQIRAPLFMQGGRTISTAQQRKSSRWQMRYDTKEG
jgi:dipeptidyl aminopeptidase/acylaminoacyl peptidase